MLVSALAFRLALAIVDRTTQSNTKRAALEALYQGVLRKAKVADVREQSPADFYTPESVETRFT
jgi:hypothetical protein